MSSFEMMALILEKVKGCENVFQPTFGWSFQNEITLTIGGEDYKVEAEKNRFKITCSLSEKPYYFDNELLVLHHLSDMADIAINEVA